MGHARIVTEGAVGRDRWAYREGGVVINAADRCGRPCTRGRPPPPGWGRASSWAHAAGGGPARCGGSGGQTARLTRRDWDATSSSWSRTLPFDERGRLIVVSPPEPRRHRYPGPWPVDQAALAGIVFRAHDRHHLEPAVHRAGRLLGDLLAAPAELDGVGIWLTWHALLLANPRATGQLDLDQCLIDGSQVRALKGGTWSAHCRSNAVDPVPSTI